MGMGTGFGKWPDGERNRANHVPDSGDRPEPAHEGTANPAAPRNLLGAAWMLGSGFTFTLMGVCTKHLGHRYDPALLAFFRSALGFVVMLPWILRAGPAIWRSSRPGKLLWRSAWGTAGFILSFYAFVLLPLAEANAISFSRTLFIVPLAFFLLREPVGPRRWGAALVGFVGVLVMLRLWERWNGAGAGLSFGALAALGAAFSFAVSIITVKDMTRDHSPLTLLLYSNLLTAIMIGPFLLTAWRVPDPADMPLILGMAAAGLAAQGCYIKGLSVGEASVVSAVDYLRLPMTASADFILARIVPGTSTLVGAAIVIASSLYITLREARLKLWHPGRKSEGM